MTLFYFIKTPGRRQRWLRWLLWLAALALLVGVLQSVSLPAVWDAFSWLGSGPLLALAAANGLVLVASTGRWWLLLRAWGHIIPFDKLIGYRLAAFGVSYFTPGPQFGGEPLQVYLVTRHHNVPSVTALAAVTLDRLLELLVNFSFLMGGVLLITHQQLFSAKVQAAMALFVVGLLALPLGGLVILARGGRPLSGTLSLVGRWSAPLTKRLPGTCRARWYQTAVAAARASEQETAAFCRRRPLILTLALLISVVSWAALIGEYWLMLWLMGARISLFQTVVALTAARLAILLPLPGGLGALEASQVLAMGFLGVDPAIGLSAGLFIRLRDVLLSGLGLWWGGLKS